MPEKYEPAPREWDWACCQCSTHNCDLVADDGCCESCGHEAIDCTSCLGSMQRGTDRSQIYIERVTSVPAWGRGWFWASQGDGTTGSMPTSDTARCGDNREARLCISSTSAAGAGAIEAASEDSPFDNEDDSTDEQEGWEGSSGFDLDAGAEEDDEDGDEDGYKDREVAAARLRAHCQHTDPHRLNWAAVTIPLRVVAGVSGLLAIAFCCRVIIRSRR